MAVATERGATLGIDQAILFALHSWRDGRPVGPVWLAEAVPDVIALGSTTVLFATTVLAVVYLARDAPKMASTLLLTVMSAQATSTILKRLVDRQRPTIPNAPTVFAATNSVA